MKKDLFKCDPNKVAMLAIVRYQNIGIQTKGCLFLGEDYICDTLEGPITTEEDDYNPHAAFPCGNYYMAKKKLKRVSLGGGFYRPGETRLYFMKSYNTYGQLADSMVFAKHGNVSVGFRGDLGIVGPQPMKAGENMKLFLTSLLTQLDYVLVSVITAAQYDVDLLRKSTLWNKGYLLSGYERNNLSLFRDMFCEHTEKPTLDSLIEISKLK